MSLDRPVGLALPDGSDGRETEFVSVILGSGDSRPVPSVDGLALLGGDGARSPEDVTEEPQPTDSRNDAPTSELEQITPNSFNVTPTGASTGQTLQRLDK